MTKCTVYSAASGKISPSVPIDADDYPADKPLQSAGTKILIVRTAEAVFRVNQTCGVWQNETFCDNDTSVHKDVDIQRKANHLFLFSTLCLILPSIPVSIYLGAICDKRNVKASILIPLFGLTMGDVNYIIQSFYFKLNPAFLLISDIIFGFCGGFPSVIGMMLAYAMKQNIDKSLAGHRMAILEGAMGIGSALGFMASGTVRKLIGFVGIFVMLLLIRIICIIYVAFVLDDIDLNLPEILNLGNSDSVVDVPEQHKLHPFFTIKQNFVDSYAVLTKKRSSRKTLILVLIALALELFVFAGVNDVYFSFLRFTLQWDDKLYGINRGLISTFSTISVLFIYPVLRKRGFADLTLCVIAILGKIINLTALSFVFSATYAFSLTVLAIFNRFIPTALRSTASQAVQFSEQGKVLSIMGVLQALASLFGSIVFNSIYPLTLPSSPFLCFIIAAGILIIPLLLSAYLHMKNSSIFLV